MAAAGTGGHGVGPRGARSSWRCRRLVFALIIVHQGGEIFAAGMFVLGVVAMDELYTLMGRVLPPRARRFPDLAAMIVADSGAISSW